ncbi:MAG: hypothetical protein M3R27_12895 [Bacteroidota bacterium]|nr:hypothetical protein [Bacteroidota bacterium]
MPFKSYIYQNLFTYRLGMNLLYKGKYEERFSAVCRLLNSGSVTELCFADTFIAECCREKGITWTGIDIHEGFVRSAIKKNYNAVAGDLNSMETFPEADTCIIAGSLYHFHENIESFFKKMLHCAPRIIISEPVMNLSSRNGIIGKLAQLSASVNGENHSFRYTEESLTDLLNRLSIKLNFQYNIESRSGKDLIISIRR